MSTATATTKQFIEDYIKDLTRKPKTEALIDQWVADSTLKQHILDFEASFPDYQIIPQHIVVEGDIAAINATATGVHKGNFAGIPPTGKSISAGAMMFYQVSNGRIVKFWMQADMPSIINQLKS